VHFIDFLAVAHQVDEQEILDLDDWLISKYGEGASELDFICKESDKRKYIKQIKDIKFTKIVVGHALNDLDNPNDCANKKDSLPPQKKAASAASAPPGQSADLNSPALQLARAYLTAWSDPADPDGNGIRRFYADAVIYYGRPLTADALMLEKRAFAHRWPVRSYVPREGSWAVSCSNETVCTVSGVVDWRAENTATGRRLSGAATFSMSVQDGHITSEAGEVTSRGR
jgi:hypothetical protein